MKNPLLDERLICPTCGAHLEEAPEALACASCARTYPLQGGVPIFVDSPTYWGEVPQDVIRAVLTRGREVGWQTAVTELLCPEYEEIKEYLQQAYRADWRFLLPDTSAWRVLDLGAGWGPHQSSSLSGNPRGGRP